MFFVIEIFEKTLADFSKNIVKVAYLNLFNKWYMTATKLET